MNQCGLEYTSTLNQCLESLYKLSLSQTYYLLCFLFNKIGEQGTTGSTWKKGGWEVGRWLEVVQTMYTHVSKCKNDKIKREEKERRLKNVNV
jgi:hypothetical protein